MPNPASGTRARFRALHESGCFALPNPWDVGSARLLQHLGFQAIASTSSGFAWTAGRPDYAVTRDGVLAHLAALAQAVDLPVNADFESGFGADADGVAESVALAIETGIAGLSIEDRDLERLRLYDTPTALERLRAARDAIEASGQDVLLVARTEELLIDPAAVNAATEKLVAFAEAGADCLYAPGVRSREDIRAMVRAVAPKPLNVLALDTGVTLPELADLGVRRVSVGGALAAVGWDAVVRAAKGIRDGSFSDLANRMPGDVLNGIFDGASPQRP
ncbi:isocitrate lyase/phosphoenolpyruvate mutase family protein (plasmid) [Methylobacterium sp. NMS12]|uniref:isocitrate lyase/PEP mutase family protein n=1 Tax=Methylobacterium sp. NMS12 TaxID=3079766 RepID=UPI003F8812E7